MSLLLVLTLAAMGEKRNRDRFISRRISTHKTEARMGGAAFVPLGGARVREWYGSCVAGWRRLKNVPLSQMHGFAAPVLDNAPKVQEVKKVLPL